jgi:hypothetical protein
MYRKSEKNSLDFGQIMAIEKTQKQLFLAFFIFHFHFWLYIDHRQKKKRLAVSYLGLLFFIHLNLWVTFSSAINF